MPNRSAGDKQPVRQFDPQLSGDDVRTVPRSRTARERERLGADRARMPSGAKTVLESPQLFRSSSAVIPSRGA
jgi:hypothetical protein